MYRGRSVTYYDGNRIEVGIRVVASQNEFTTLIPSRTLQVVQDVLEHGAKCGKHRFENGELTVKECLDHALEHIAEHLYLTFHPEEAGNPSEDHLAHAMTRLFMAVAIDRKHVDPEEMSIGKRDGI